MGNRASLTVGVSHNAMSELVPYFVGILLAAIVSRSVAVLVARWQVDKTPGEQELAKLPFLPYRDVSVQADTFHACFLAMRNKGIWRPAGAIALLHVCLWFALIGVLLLMAAREIISFDWSSV